MTDTTNAAIAEAMDLALRYLQRHPEPMADSPVTATVHAGLRVRTIGPGDWSTTTDMPAEVGGGASAPTPGTLLRAALAACDATTLAMCAAEAGIELAGVQVTVASSSDHRGLLGAEGVSAAPVEIVVEYHVAAPGIDAEQVRHLVDVAEARSPVAVALRRPAPLHTVVTVT